MLNRFAIRKNSESYKIHLVRSNKNTFLKSLNYCSTRNITNIPVHSFERGRSYAFEYNRILRIHVSSFLNILINPEYKIRHYYTVAINRGHGMAGIRC